jgi:ubiquinone/menaquinone biosynthesis C-methylase UbiE
MRIAAAGTAIAVAAALWVAWQRRHPAPYPAAFARLLDSPLRRVVLDPEAFARRLVLTPGTRVLEIGPGSGLVSEAVARAAPGARLVCLDVQPAMLTILRRRLARRGLAGPPPALVCGTASALPFRDGSFDRVVLVNVLGEVPDRAGALREGARLLADGGELVLFESLPDPDYILPRALTRAAARAGLVPLGRHGAWPAYTLRLGRGAHGG